MRSRPSAERSPPKPLALQVDIIKIIVRWIGPEFPNYRQRKYPLFGFPTPRSQHHATLGNQRRAGRKPRIHSQFPAGGPLAAELKTLQFMRHTTKGRAQNLILSRRHQVAPLREPRPPPPRALQKPLSILRTRETRPVRSEPRRRIDFHPALRKPVRRTDRRSVTAIAHPPDRDDLAVEEASHRERISRTAKTGAATRATASTSGPSSQPTRCFRRGS